MDYYNINAKSYFDSTFSINMEKVYQPFLNHIPDEGVIIDAGCGAGRDALAFTERGYQVLAFDDSENLVELVNAETGLKVECCDFMDFYTEPESVDGLWACGAFIHTPYEQLHDIMAHLLLFLKPDGIVHTSFKYGEEDIDEAERHYTNMTESRIDKLAADLNLSIRHLWITPDQRPDRSNEKWLNVLLKKKLDN